MEPTNEESHTRRPIGFVIAIALSVGLAAGMCLLMLSASRSVPLDRNEAGSVARAFMHAMAFHDARTAKSLVVAEKWGRIDSWVSQRRVFRCSIIDDILGRSMFDGGGLNDYRWDGTYRCASYYFSVEDMLVDGTEEGFIILDWGTICEGQDILDGTRRCE